MKILFYAICLTACSGAFCQLSVDLIPEELKKDADAIIRFDRGEYQIGKIDRATSKYHYAVTIFNKDARHFAFPYVHYDKLKKIVSFEATVYDKNGERISKVKKSDIVDESRISGFSLYEDDRIQWADLSQETYPYTVEFEYQVKYRYLYTLPDWHFVPDERISVQNSEFKISYPPELAPRYYTTNFDGEFDSINADGLITLHWQIKDYPAKEREPYGPGFYALVPVVHLAPGKFDYDGYVGDMSTWDGLAKWQSMLNAGRDELPQSTIDKVKSMTEGKSEIEKIKTVYEYVQNSTRYVSIQLGIGGFQPFPAKVVDEVGYGDCKALSFYTQSLLKHAGISAYYTWVSAGDSPDMVRDDFPNDTFNHIILCVPVENDTIWLECTNQTIPFGYIGSFTDNRKVLVIDGQKGSIVKTKKYALEDNQTLTSADFHLDDQGNADVSIKLTQKGLSYEDKGLGSYMNLSQEEQRKWIERSIEIPSLSIKKFEFINHKDIVPSAEVRVEVGARKIISKSGNRFFLQPNILSKQTSIPEKNDSREQPVFVRSSWSESDSITFHLPPTVSVEATFNPITIESVFGKYHIEMKTDSDAAITYIRKFEFYEGRYTPETYTELYDFLKQVSLADKKRISLVSKT